MVAYAKLITYPQPHQITAQRGDHGVSQGTAINCFTLGFDPDTLTYTYWEGVRIERNTTLNDAVALGNESGHLRLVALDRHLPPKIVNGEAPAAIYGADVKSVEINGKNRYFLVFHSSNGHVVIMVRTGHPSIRRMKQRHEHNVTVAKGSPTLIDAGDFKSSAGEIVSRDYLYKMRTGDKLLVKLVNGSQWVVGFEKGKLYLEDCSDETAENCSSTDPEANDGAGWKKKGNDLLCRPYLNDEDVADFVKSCPFGDVLDTIGQQLIGKLNAQKARFAEAREKQQQTLWSQEGQKLLKRFPTDRESFEKFRGCPFLEIRQEVFGAIAEDSLVHLQKRAAAAQGEGWSKEDYYVMNLLPIAADQSGILVPLAEELRRIPANLPDWLKLKLPPVIKENGPPSPERAKTNAHRAELKAKRHALQPSKGKAGQQPDKHSHKKGRKK